MKNQYEILAGALVFAFAVLVQVGRAQETTHHTISRPVSAEPFVERFDDLVRDDFFSGKPELFKRAMQLCGDTLAKNPKHAQAMVWHGSGLLSLGGQAFQTNDVVTGINLWQRGLEEMAAAVTLESENVAVLIARGATLLPAAKYVPDPAQAKELTRTGVGDYEKVLKLQKLYFEKLSTHARGELLFGLADGWYRLGDLEKSREYLSRIVQDCAESVYAKRAKDWLETKDVKVLRKKSDALSCVGCHGR